MPTACAVPSALAYEAEEVRRVMAARPPVVEKMDQPLAPWNRQSLAVAAPLPAREGRLEGIAPREDAHELVYVRRDLAR